MLSVQNLTKYFGNFKALDSISFTVIKGKIVGLLGPNGAGKTTTIRIIIGILPKTSGMIKLNEQILDPRSRAWKLQFGVVPEVSNAYLDYSPLKNLILSGRLYGLSKQYCKSSALKFLEEFDIIDKKK
ncbi:MAG: ATP-binding cassette domain-containing protein [Candidatus Helarchaeota archaeon]